jgi:MerR family mercuric resistance operon transcriptional regulator
VAKSFSIGTLARTAEIPVSTVRYYERIGLLSPKGRTRSNYRYYDAEALERLLFIRASQTTGFSLDDVTALLRISDGSVAPCREVQELIEARLAAIEARQKDLHHVRRELRASLIRCRRSHSPDQCELLEALSGDVSSASIRKRRLRKKSS